MSIIQDSGENTMGTTRLEQLWYTRCGVPTAIGLAVQLGWLERSFALDGTVIRSIRDSEDQKIRQSHFDHHLRHSVRQGGSSPAIWARAEGRDTRVIGLIRTDESQQILALPDSKIRSVKDLKGRRLALPKRETSNFPALDVRGAAALKGYLSALSTEGLGAKDVEFVELRREDAGPGAPNTRRSFAYSFGDEVRALLAGDVDAIYVKDSRGQAVASFLNAVEVIDLGKHPEPSVRVNYGWPRPLTVDAGLLRDYPEAAERLLALVIAAGEWAKEHRSETLRLVAHEVGTPEHFVALAHPNLHENLVTDLREDWVGWFGEYKQFLLEHGFLRNDFELSAWIDDSVLERVRSRGPANWKRELDAALVPPDAAHAPN
jgi:ABC-type nitrate/sulfonate/bicarbonate transport system substrate-binding protein